MAPLSTDLRQVVAILNDEARDLIELGRHYPDHAREIGKLIVAYHKMILRLREQADAGSGQTVQGEGLWSG